MVKIRVIWGMMPSVLVHSCCFHLQDPIIRRFFQRFFPEDGSSRSPETMVTINGQGIYAKAIQYHSTTV